MFLRGRWIASIASKTGVTIFIHSRYRLQKINVPHPVDEVYAFTV